MESATARLTEQKLKMRYQNLLIERMNASLTATQDVAADELFSSADRLVEEIAAGLCSVEDAVQRLVSGEGNVVAAVETDTAETGADADMVNEDATAESTTVEAEETEAESKAPFVPAPTFYSGGAEWRGKKKASGVSLPIGTPAVTR